MQSRWHAPSTFLPKSQYSLIHLRLLTSTPTNKSSPGRRIPKLLRSVSRLEYSSFKIRKGSFFVNRYPAAVSKIAKQANPSPSVYWTQSSSVWPVHARHAPIRLATKRRRAYQHLATTKPTLPHTHTPTRHMDPRCWEYETGGPVLFHSLYNKSTRKSYVQQVHRWQEKKSNKNNGLWPGEKLRPSSLLPFALLGFNGAICSVRAATPKAQLQVLRDAHFYKYSIHQNKLMLMKCWKKSMDLSNMSMMYNVKYYDYSNQNIISNGTELIIL